jgi:hypothetical protein
LQRVNPRKLRFTNDTRLAPQLKLPGHAAMHCAGMNLCKDRADFAASAARGLVI